MLARLTLLALGLSALSASSAVGCAAPAADEDTSDSASSIVGGTATYERPEVGVLSYSDSRGEFCTATVVAPKVVITAAHCFAYQSRDLSSEALVFKIEKSASLVLDFPLAEVRSFTAHVGPSEDDIAIVRLASAVGPTDARPVDLADRWPSWGTRVAMYGYGCTNRETGEGKGVKRKVEFAYTVGFSAGWTGSHSCPLDSGGSLVDTSRRSIVGITSGYIGGYDVFGDVPKHHDELGRWLDAWR